MASETIVANCAVDAAVAFANRLIIEGWCEPEFEISEVFVAIQAAGRRMPVMALARLCRHDVAEALNRSIDAERNIFGVLVCVELDLAHVLAADRFEVAFGNSAHLLQKFFVNVDVVGIIGTRSNPTARAMIERAVELKLLNPALGTVMRAADGGFKDVPTLLCHVDGTARIGQVIAVEMWVANAQERRLVAISDDGVAAVFQSDIMYASRPDVTTHIQNLGITPMTNNHGVILLFTCAQIGVSSVIVASVSNGVLDGVAIVSAAPTATADHLIDRIFQVRAGPPDPVTARRIFSPMLIQKRPVPEWRTHVLLEGDQLPDLSIIVPFYREDAFLRSLTTMQIMFAQSVEWVFVSDDPDLHSAMLSYLSRRKGFLRNRTVLVTNGANYGYSTANAIGARVAKGEFLLFMNSDIWIDDVSCFEVGAAAIENGNYGAVGFRLLYEDGTLQHDGLRFQRANHLHSLYVIEHPRKGLPPPRPGRHDVVAVDGVTGALLLISRTVYDQIGGFNDRYVRGDFEDGDLCLKIRAAGYKIGLVRQNAQYHLERQSIRLMGDAGLRNAITYLNCILFNDIWGSVLAGQSVGDKREGGVEDESDGYRPRASRAVARGG
jgi:GT2 family glycosyltransferase